MIRLQNILKVSLFCSALVVLTACGEGWDRGMYEGTPYHGKRTAGGVVQYVRARMAPAKPPAVEPPPIVHPEPAEVEAPVIEKIETSEPPIRDAEPLFRAQQRKAK